MKVTVEDGFLLCPNPEQRKIISEACAHYGYPLDAAGVLGLLIELLATADMDDEDEEIHEAMPPENPLQKLVSYYRENPDKLRTAVDTGAALFRAALRKRKP